MKQLVLLRLGVDHQEETAKVCKLLQREKTPKGISPSGKKKQPPCQKYLKKNFTEPSCEYWHPPELCQAQNQRGLQFRRQVFCFCKQATVTSRRNRENGTPTHPPRWCETFSSRDASFRVLILCQKTRKDPEERQKILEHRSPTAVLSNRTFH